jgi:pimeloyl-ACP methyl ester carboxylesterase
MRLARLTALTLILLAGCQTGPDPVLVDEPLDPGVYDYPIDSPFAATVVGTPAEFRAVLPQDYPVEEINLRLQPDREVPEVLWFHERLRVSVVRQNGPAPLVFSIGGTGADNRSRTVKIMEAILAASGFHVISLASPTHPNFVVAGSVTGVPGRVGEDVRDLYRAMQAAYARVQPELEVTDFYLTGYSLGGWHAAFLAHLDEREQAFGFGKVLLINPPVSLFESIGILDTMLEKNLPGGMSGVNDFFDQIFKGFSDIYSRAEFVDFSDDFLYRAYRELDPTEEKLGALIGLAFRMSANNMAFTADVMNDGGYIIPRGARLKTSTTLTPFFKAGARAGFIDYLDDFYEPFFTARHPGLTHEELVAEANLERIEDYLRDNDKIGLLHNADDIILGPGDLDFLRRVFGPRAIILPNGGHLGNIEHRFVVAAISKFFRSKPGS